MHIYNPSFNPSNFIANTNIHTYYRSNNRLKFSERISLLCKKIFQSSLHPFFTYINRDQFQSQ
ncbi:hypothetical protein [Candidatus Protochlamydia sp. W-9]|uniref:hypothetical protein n=1 Tax=Candidatus Protochlamydia sp. W-9 TaxID=1785087 RepID=UPI00096A99EB|nr:hypothetical protein [Candidatus Protochlamydia sp. W-9]